MGEHRLDAAVAHLESLVREDFAERRSTQPPPWWSAEHTAARWRRCLVAERADLRSYIAALRVIRRKRDDDMDDSRGE